MTWGRADLRAKTGWVCFFELSHENVKFGESRDMKLFVMHDAGAPEICVDIFPVLTSIPSKSVSTKSLWMWPFGNRVIVDVIWFSWGPLGVRWVLSPVWLRILWESNWNTKSRTQGERCLTKVEIGVTRAPATARWGLPCYWVR